MLPVTRIRPVKISATELEPTTVAFSVARSMLKSAEVINATGAPATSITPFTAAKIPLLFCAVGEVKY